MNDTQSQSPLNQPKDSNYHVVPASHGILWIKRAIALFQRNPAAWLSCSLVLIFSFIFLLFLVVFIPLLLPASFILTSIYLGGLMKGSHQLFQYKEFHVRDLFAGFEHQTAPLCIIGIIYFAGSFLSSLIGVGFSELIGFQMPDQELIQRALSDPQASQEFMQALAMPILFTLGFMIPVLMAFWFAPALSMFFDDKPVPAMIKSLKACAANTMPFLVYGIVATFAILFLSIIAAVISIYIPLLGVAIKFFLQLTFTSVLIASIYTSFEDIFPGLNSEQPDETEDVIDENSDSLIL